MQKPLSVLEGKTIVVDKIIVVLKLLPKARKPKPYTVCKFCSTPIVNKHVDPKN